jgi:hypothetical protein
LLWRAGFLPLLLVLSAAVTPPATYLSSAVGTWVWLNAAASCLNCSRPSANSCLQQQYGTNGNASDTAVLCQS